MRVEYRDARAARQINSASTSVHILPDFLPPSPGIRAVGAFLLPLPWQTLIYLWGMRIRRASAV